MKTTTNTLNTNVLNNNALNSNALNSNAKVKRGIQQAIKEVEWKDLRSLTQAQVAYNLILPYPFLLVSWWFASQSLYVLACSCSYLFFASAFRQAHDGYHHSLGVGKRSTMIILMLLSVLLMTGLHSIRATHMQHHRDPLGENDVEGSLAKLSWWQALIGGIRYRFTIYKRGMQLSSVKNRRKAWLEFTLIGMVITLIGAAAGFSVLQTELVTRSGYSTYTAIVQVAVYHLIVMLSANSVVGLIAVWGVHHDTDKQSIARTERNKVVNLLTFGLLFHVEHHLFPAVPTNNLPKLAQRLDLIAPHLTETRVIPSKQNITTFITNSCNELKSYSNDADDKTCPIRGLFA